MADTKKTKILIIGGGFAGVYTAMELERLLKRDPSVEINLVSKENYIVFQPMLPEVISGAIGLTDVISPIRRLCPRTNLFTRPVESIDLAKKRVTAASGFDSREYYLSYDHLVIAVGNLTSFAGQSGLMEHAVPFKTLGDGLVLRNHVIHAMEEADIEQDPEIRKALLTFVIGGGGFSVVEAIAELNDFVRISVKHFRNINPKEIRTVLLHSGPLILPELPESLAQYAQNLLVQRGVEVMTKTRLQGATAGYALLSNGERIPTRTLVSTVPSTANPLVNDLPVKKEKGRIVVNQFLEVPDAPGLWAAGDCAWIVDPETGEPHPPTAQHAIREARCLAQNIVATIRVGAKKPFHFHALGKLGALGHQRAVAEMLGVKLGSNRLTSFVAWIMWRFIYLMKMPGLDRKVRVAVGWFLDLILGADIVQLRTDRGASIRREHFEAGETIFREGDRGDRVYVIVDGEIDILRAAPGGGETLVRRLVQGETFGEIALVRDMPRTAAARSVSKVNLLSMDRETFQTLFATMPPLRRLFEELIDSRIGAATPR